MMDNFWREMVCAIIFGAIIGKAIANWDRDDTDVPKGEGRRSGLSLFKDAGTGCEYVGIFGALIPRVDASGNHICGE
jgi:hypothetical protein